MRSSRSAPDPLDPGPAGFAHRGEHGEGIPENSLAAFRGALNKGAGIECDLRLSADGVPMVFHDRDAMRLSGSAAICSATSAEELSALSLGRGGERIPRLTELLALVAGRLPLLLELKTEDNAGRFTRAIVAALSRYRGPVGVMSFDPRVGFRLAIRAPQVRRGLVLSGRDRAPLRWAKLLLAHPQFLAVKRTALHRGWVARARGQMPVYGWTIRAPADRAQAAVQADALIWEANGRP